MQVVAQGGGGKRAPFCRRMEVKAFHAHRDNMQESQDNAADPVHLVIDNLLYSRPTFVIEILPFESDVTILLSRLSYQNVTPASIKHSFAASMTAVLVTVAPLTASIFGVPELSSFSRSVGIACPPYCGVSLSPEIVASVSLPFSNVQVTVTSPPIGWLRKKLRLRYSYVMFLFSNSLRERKRKKK